MARSTGAGSRRARIAPAALALVAALPGLTATGLAAPPQSLAGTTVFTATRNATTIVRLPRPATLTIGVPDSPSLDFSATGRLSGFALTRASRPVGDPQTFGAFRVGACTAPRCLPRPPHKAYEYAASSGFAERSIGGTTWETTLPAGDYVVRSLVDGSPIRMTMRLAGLRGSTTVRVARPLRPSNRVVLETYSSRGGPAGIDPMRTGAGTHPIESDVGLMFHVVMNEYEPHLRNLTAHCYYWEHEPERVLPGCPGSSYEFLYNRGQPALRYDGIGFGLDFTLRAGAWTHAFYAVGVGGPSTFDATALWMDV